MPAVAPGTMEHWMKNQYYPTNEAYLFAIADAMHEEYKAIVDAGFILQIDDPDLADAWQMYPQMSVAEYRKYQELRIEALNHGLRDLPIDRVRFHMCWGSYHGPHKYDIPLRDIVDLILKVRAGAYSIEASNPCHEHEWRVWQEVKFPDEKIYIPGVVGHYSDFIEHPQAIADRLVQYAKLIGRETSSQARTAASAREWVIRKLPGRSSNRWPKAPGLPRSNFGDSDPLLRPPPQRGEGRGGGFHFNPNSLAALPPKTFSLSSTVSPAMPLIAETWPASIIGVG